MGQQNSRQALKALATASIGGALEMYDFVIYVYVAPIIAFHFFPKTNHIVALMATFGLFAVGYLARPFGGIVFGHFGDKHGRKKGLLLTIILMAIATTGMGLLPTYQQVGLLAPILLLLFRLLQGFAVGGDLPGAITFIYEVSPYKRRGLFCSIIYFGVNFGILFASLLTFLLTSVMSDTAFHQWGWRLGFLFSVVLFVVGYYLRNQLEETPAFLQMQAEQTAHKVPVLHLIKKHPAALIRCVGLMWLCAAIIPQIFLYMPTYLQKTVGLSTHLSLLYNTLSLVLFTLMIPVMGALSDHVGRKNLLFISALLFALGSMPLYSAMQSQYTATLVLAMATFAIFSAIFIGSLISTLAEQFTAEVRYSGIGFSYNLGFAVFGGLTPLICTYLIYHLHNPAALSINLIVAALFTLFLTTPRIFSIKEI